MSTGSNGSILLKKSCFRRDDGFSPDAFSTADVDEDASLNGATAPMLSIQPRACFQGIRA
jgi:hypothetical protein